MTDNKETLNSALFAVQGALKGVIKDGDNPHFQKPYATLASVTDTIRPAMQANNLMWMHSPVNTDNPMVVSIVTKITHVPTGETLEATLNIPIQKADAQKIGSAMTYAMRYTLMALLGLAPKDDDGNEATKNDQPPKAQSREYFTACANGIAKAGTIDDLKTHFTAGIDWSKIPADWATELVSQKDARVKELQQTSKSANDSLDAQFPGDLPFESEGTNGA